MQTCQKKGTKDKKEEHFQEKEPKDKDRQKKS